MNDELLQLLLSIHHQLTTDSDLDTVTAPDKYRHLVYEIEKVLINTPYAYLCERYRETEALGRRGCYAQNACVHPVDKQENA